MRTISSRSSIAGLCVLGVALGACGGSSSSSYKGLSKAEFVKEANAICRAGQKKLAAASAKIGKDTPIATWKKLYREEFGGAIHSEIRQLGALKPPDADRQRISKMLDELTTGVEQLLTSVGAATSIGDLAKVHEPASAKAALSTAKSYGLTSCGDTG